MLSRLIIAALMLTMLAGCASAKKSFKEGSSSEAEGRWAQATEQYVDALLRDPEFPGARERARETGNRTVDGYLRVANGLEERRRYDPALKEYARIDFLLDRTAAVGVILDLPADYHARKKSTLYLAIEDAMIRAGRIASDGRWRHAINAYREVAIRYQLSSDQLATLRDAQFDQYLVGMNNEIRDEHFDNAEAAALEAMEIFGITSPKSNPVHALLQTIHTRQYQTRIASARDLVDAGQFQTALRHVEGALDVYGPDAPESQTARDLLDRVIELGTVQVAAMPLWWSHDLDTPIKDDLLGDMEDALFDALAGEPPLFIDMVDPADVRRAIHRLDYDRQAISPPRALTIADRLDSDFVTIFTIDHFEYLLTGRPQTHEVATRHHDETTIIEVYPRRELHIKCTFALVSAIEGRVIYRQRLELSAGIKLKHARYDGDLDDLLLTQTQHSWFDERKLHEAEHEIEQEIADTLAHDLSGLVYESILGYLP